MTATRSISPDRIAWADRQLLAGGDLRAAHAHLDARRARHVRGAHGTWGVAFGLAVTVGRLPAGIAIGPGLAYDARGRELVVQRTTTLPMPDGAPGGPTPVLVAARSAGDRRVPDVDLRVVDARDPLRPGVDVLLAEVDLTTGVADPRDRPHVASMAPPRIAGGFVPAGGVGISGTSVTFVATIDTSGAAFETTPYYVVQPLLGISAPLPEETFGPLIGVHDATATGFVLEVRYAARTAGQLQSLRARAKPAALPFGLSWLGVEPPPQAGVDDAPEADCPCLL